jgi:hypothetical protein
MTERFQSSRPTDASLIQWEHLWSRIGAFADFKERS